MASGDWWRHGVIYQVYPRSFQDSNGDGIGDLAGITSRLDHLNDGTPASLGVDAIWLSPFYRSPMADFGYDVADYRDVHPDYGSLADFDELLRQAHRRGIRVLVDLVPNHTSHEHPWFVDSRAGRDAARRDWYVWRDPAPGGGPPNNWRSTFRRTGPAWTFDPRTGQYYLHSFLPEQPDLDWWNPAVRAAMDEVLRFWLDRGVDGFRVDVAHKMARDPELRDNPPDLDAPGVRRRDEDWEPAVHDILRGFRRVLDGYPERMAVGEVFILDPRRMVRYYGEALDELHLAFNFSFLRQPWLAEGFRAAADEYESVLPPGAWPDYTLSNHDNPRARSRYDRDDGESGRRRARVGMLMLLTLRGTPFLYYGEEIGQADGEVRPEQVVDVAGRDPERTPMQWDDGPAAGFTTGTPWLPVGAEARQVNVAAQRDDPASMLTFVRRAIWYRKASPALRWGSYRSLDVAGGVFGYVRQAAGERLLVLLDFWGAERRLDLRAVLARAGLGAGSGASGPGASDAQVELSTDPGRPAGEVDLARVGLGPDEGLVLRLE
ncbi:MAG TPA: alpha-amylase family glycosyl hydrolase [Candidatus Limnocylindrales bacterium]